MPMKTVSYIYAINVMSRSTSAHVVIGCRNGEFTNDFPEANGEAVRHYARPLKPSSLSFHGIQTLLPANHTPSIRVLLLQKSLSAAYPQMFIAAFFAPPSTPSPPSGCCCVVMSDCVCYAAPYGVRISIALIVECKPDAQERILRSRQSYRCLKCQ